MQITTEGYIVILLIIYSVTYLINYSIKANKKVPKKNTLSNFELKIIKPIYQMSGDEFTEHVVTIFQKHFWESRVNLRKPDMGVDLFTTSPSGITYGIECKNWKNTVGNGVVRSVAEGKRFYQVKKAVVISARSEFTKPAKDQSRASAVILIRFQDLEKWIEKNS